MPPKDQAANSIPPWIRRLMVVMVLLACAAAAFILDQYFARRRFDAAVAARRALGEPVLPADFELAPIPDDENAAFFIRRAAAAIQFTADEEELMERYLHAPASPATSDTQAMAAVITRRPEVFRDMAAAQRCLKVVWGVRWGTDPLLAPRPHLKDNRQLGNLLHAAARTSHLLGRDAETTAYIQSLLFLADATDQEGGVVSRLVAIAIRAMACQSVYETSLDLDGVTRQAMRAIATALLDESHEHPRITLALRCDRMQTAIAMKQLGAQNVLAPSLFNRVAVRGLDRFDAMLPGFLASDYPTSKSLLSVAGSGKSGAGEALISIFTPALEAWCNREFRILCERRVAATALAIRLYLLDHANQLPTQLSDLVPAYLPEVPKDPFAAGGKPLNYRPSPRPAIYSVGEDGVDNGMDDKPRRRDGTYDEWCSRDAIFYLGPGSPP